MLSYDNYIDSLIISEDDVNTDEVNDVSEEKSSSENDISSNSSSENTEDVKSENESVENDASSDSSSKNTEDIKSENESVENDASSDSKFIFPYIIGKKIGMTQLYSDDGTVFPATVVEAGPCFVTQIKDIDSDGYNSVQLGYLERKKSRTSKPLNGHFQKSGVSPKKILKEFRVFNEVNDLKLGDEVNVDQFTSGDSVTVTGFSKGRGFAGHMKRHGFSGGRASHGKNSVMRKSGSVGAGTSPGRIFPGMKMAGRMGNQKTTVKNLLILSIDIDKNLLFIKGSIPGPNNRIIFLNKNI